VQSQTVVPGHLHLCSGPGQASHTAFRQGLCHLGTLVLLLYYDYYYYYDNYYYSTFMLSSPAKHQETRGDMCFESKAQCSTMCVLLVMS
jgi:hypothetical protein